MKLSTNSARACLDLTLPFKAWSVETVTNCSGFPGLSGFLGCADVELSMLKPGKSVANLGESITLSADQQYWRQPGSFLEMQFQASPQNYWVRICIFQEPHDLQVHIKDGGLCLPQEKKGLPQPRNVCLQGSHLLLGKLHSVVPTGL